VTPPNLKNKALPEGPGVAPPKLKAWLSNIPEDFRTVIDWAIQNFLSKEGEANAPGGGGGGGGGIIVTDGTTTLIGITKISFDGALFTVSTGGSGVANVTLKTTAC
jgi:hypothetical protein